VPLSAFTSHLPVVERQGAYPALTEISHPAVAPDLYYAWAYFSYGLPKDLVDANMIERIEVQVTATNSETLTLYTEGTELLNLIALPGHSTPFSVGADQYYEFG
jgi:hypothetical protein